MEVLWCREVCAVKKVPLLHCCYLILLKGDEGFSGGSVTLLGDADRLGSVTERMGFGFGF